MLNIIDKRDAASKRIVVAKTNKFIFRPRGIFMKQFSTAVAYGDGNEVANSAT